MKAREIMTRDVRTVGPDTTIAVIAKTLLKQRISGVPVVEDGEIIGIVSEGDLIHRCDTGAGGRAASWWRKLFKGGHSKVEFINVNGLTAREVMTRPAITVTEETPLEEVVDLFEARHIKRVPVEKDGTLVGIVTRANFLHVLTDYGLFVAPGSRFSPESDFLDDQTVAHVQTSFARLAPQINQFAKAFYGRLFKDNPHIAHMHRRGLTEQEIKFGAMFTTIVSGLDRPELIRASLDGLGRRHVGYGVRPTDYALYGDALKWTLAKFLGDEFRPEVEIAWNDFFLFIANEMQNGGGDEHQHPADPGVVEAETPQKFDVILTGVDTVQGNGLAANHAGRAIRRR